MDLGFFICNVKWLDELNTRLLHDLKIFPNVSINASVDSIQVLAFISK